jgi:hypothetical protein
MPPILITKFQTISWVNYMRLWKDPPNEYICAPTASKAYIWHVCTYFRARKFLSFDKLFVCFVLLSDFFKTTKISEISECLFVWLSILRGCLLQALIQASQSSAGCWLHTPYELCECQCSTIRVWIFWHDILFASQSWWSIPFSFLTWVLNDKPKFKHFGKP